MFEQAIADLLSRLGVRGVSVSLLLVLVSLVAWSGRARTAGHLAASGLQTARTVVVVFLGLLLLGLISIDLGRAQELLRALPDVQTLIGWFV
ncbi:hypothetical protein [Haladaptatus sp. ZSTT2]|uniref:hypothetical protein n=1 Tax=Haladaptatus sp. ZSTT2 TaxID=3120515 RepID=UPI00300EE755